MINSGTFVICCVCAWFLGWSMGTWKSAKEYAEISERLAALYFKDFNLLIDKVIAWKKGDQKDGEP